MALGVQRVLNLCNSDPAFLWLQQLENIMAVCGFRTRHNGKTHLASVEKHWEE